MLPSNKPRATQSLIQVLATDAWRHAGKEGALPSSYLLGVRGYYLNSMGVVGANDRGIYDDAIFVVGPEIFAGFNANSDPSVYKKGIATLCPGVHYYRPGKHGITRPGGGYPAFRPATKDEALPVMRDGVKLPDPGIAINIHRGGNNTTSSLGCQTLPPVQWAAFHALHTLSLKKSGMTIFPYILIEGPIN